MNGERLEIEKGVHKSVGGIGEMRRRRGVANSKGDSGRGLKTGIIWNWGRGRVKKAKGDRGGIRLRDTGYTIFRDQALPS